MSFKILLQCYGKFITDELNLMLFCGVVLKTQSIYLQINFSSSIDLTIRLLRARVV